MEDKKKKQYIIFLSIAAILFAAIILTPSPGTKAKKAPYVPPGNVEKKGEILQKIVESALGDGNETEVVSGISERRVARDLFKNPLITEQPPLVQQAQNIQPEQPKVQKEFKITGILITGDKKSCILSDGRIISEGEVVDGYKVAKIGRGEVIFISKADKSVMQVKVWEDKK